MKTSFRTFLLLFITLSLFTLVNALPLSGVKTVGGTNPDFPSLTAAIDSLNALGVANGGVTFILRGGTYREHSRVIVTPTNINRPIHFTVEDGAEVAIEIDSLPGDTIGFQLQSRHVTIDGSWTNDTLGQHLAIVGTNLRIGVWFANGSDSSIVKNCRITLPRSITHDQTEGIWVGAYDYSIIDGIRIRQCAIEGGQDGIRVIAHSSFAMNGIEISNCEISNFYWNGIWLYAYSCAKIFNNRIYQTVVTTEVGIGIYGGDSCQIVANKIGPLLSSVRVIGIIDGSHNTITNNFIRLGDMSNCAVYGILSQVGAGNKYLFNTVVTFGTSRIDSISTGNSTCFWSTGFNVDSLWGNIFVNTRTGPGQHHDCLYIDTGHDPRFSNYNLFYTAYDTVLRNCFLERHDTAHFTGFIHSARWFPRDSNSIFGLPDFSSNNDLHLRHDTTSIVHHRAPRHWLVPTDIDGEPRSAPYCDIGADEWDSVMTAIWQNTTTLPLQFSLHPNYPNPFNSSTTISYELPHAANVEIKLFDLTGREVSTLVQQWQGAGRYRLPFAGRNLSSGTYFVRMQAGEFEKTQKIVLLR